MVDVSAGRGMCVDVRILSIIIYTNTLEWIGVLKIKSTIALVLVKKHMYDVKIVFLKVKLVMTWRR